MKRTIELLRLLSAVSLLLLVILLLRQPLTWLLGDRVTGAATSLSPSALLPPPKAKGFHLEASSEPSGAILRINGKEHGTTPFIGNVICRADDPVLLEVEAAGMKAWQRTVPCRQGEVLRINARLDP